MHRPLLLRGARQLLTLRGPEGHRRGAGCLDLGIINDGSILIRDGVIVNIGPSRRVENLAEARFADVYEMHGAVAMPGFVDARAAIPESAPQARRFFELAFAHGSTTIGGYASYTVLRGLAGANPSRAALVAAIDVEPKFDAAQLIRAGRRKLAHALRVELLAHSRAALHFFHTLKLPIRVFASPGAPSDYVAMALDYAAGAIDIDSPLDADQAALLADSPLCAVLTPAAAAGARRLIDANAAVALGSGFAATPGATCSMQTAALLAAREGGLSTAEAITLATINAAHALGAAAHCGSLEIGKRADVLILNLSDYRDLSHFTGVNVVSKIFQAGNLVA